MSDPFDGPRLGVLGRGRAASALVPRWQRAGLPLAFWRGRADGPLASTPPCDVLVLAVPDGALAEVARALSHRESAARETWIHLSGVTPIGALRVSPRLPLKVGGCHPLVALTPHADPTGATAGVEGEDEETLALCARLAHAAGLRPVALAASPEARALYHAAAVSVAGHATALFAQALAMMQAAGFSATDARAALQPLLSSAALNLAHAPPEDAITGPITRGDVGTVTRHLEALVSAVRLGDLPPNAAATYRLLAMTALTLSRPRLEDAVSTALQALLDPPP